MTWTQFFFCLALFVFILIRIDIWWTRRKLQRLITDTKCRRWYPMMQQIAKSSRLKHEIH